MLKKFITLFSLVFCSTTFACDDVTTQYYSNAKDQWECDWCGTWNSNSVWECSECGTLR